MTQRHALCCHVPELWLTTLQKEVWNSFRSLLILFSISLLSWRDREKTKYCADCWTLLTVSQQNSKHDYHLLGSVCNLYFCVEFSFLVPWKQTLHLPQSDVMSSVCFSNCGGWGELSNQSSSPVCKKHRALLELSFLMICLFVTWKGEKRDLVVIGWIHRTSVWTGFIWVNNNQNKWHIWVHFLTLSLQFLFCLFVWSLYRRIHHIPAACRSVAPQHSVAFVDKIVNLTNKDFNMSQ